MEIEKLQKSTVIRLRAVKKEHGLSIPQIIEMLDKKGCYLSEATIKRVFSDNYDPMSFRYRDTIAPLADVLLDVYSDDSGSDDVNALKSLIHDKNKMIDMLMIKNEELKKDTEKRISHLQKQIDRLEKNLDFREEVVKKKDEIIAALLNKYVLTD